MSLTSHLDELRRRHGAIDKALRDAQAHPAADGAAIAEMKRRKLHIKDSIVQFETRLHS